MAQVSRSELVQAALELVFRLTGTFRYLPVVVVMESAQHRARRDLPTDRRCIWSLWPARNALLDPRVWAGLIEVGHILPHHPVQVALAQDQEVVEALSSQAT